MPPSFSATSKADMYLLEELRNFERRLKTRNCGSSSSSQTQLSESRTEESCMMRTNSPDGSIREDVSVGSEGGESSFFRTQSEPGTFASPTPRPDSCNSARSFNTEECSSNKYCLLYTSEAYLLQDSLPACQ
mmetsp:Transcript_28670/g.44920  ORF Transcript_28670/g.44920 Transcript_28670/m.44920 type:complete len:132 (-) Transcript_28670:172-567(-)